MIELSDSTSSDQARPQDCFVVMPFGKNAAERKWFAGWYEVVIKPSIEDCGYRAVLAAAEDQPGAINDEIRLHLAKDPMVVVDLGGYEPDDTPNPNVMYELGIRHAFNLPVVVMAWEGQNLPFDVGNQRAIMCQRGFKDISEVKAKLVRFVRAAEEGHYYKPMEAVGREAALDNATITLGEDSALSALISEVKYLRHSLQSAQPRPRYRAPTVKRALGKSLKSELWPFAREIGMESGDWSQFLNIKMDEELYGEASEWSIREWHVFLLRNSSRFVAKNQGDLQLKSDFLDSVDELLGPQPWPTGEAKAVAEKLEVTTTQVSKAIKQLMLSGRRLFQHDGQIFDTEDDYREALSNQTD